MLNRDIRAKHCGLLAILPIPCVFLPLAFIARKSAEFISKELDGRLSASFLPRLTLFVFDTALAPGFPVGVAITGISLGGVLFLFWRNESTRSFLPMVLSAAWMLVVLSMALLLMAILLPFVKLHTSVGFVG